uniref:ATP synthase complex subunit 8 n=1 Tax=Serilophus lunatus TaxID=239386 RepID=A0A7M3U8W8_9PASS|nr:ATP synthase F0 subunit 8 [Serilophus lunatus]QOD96125.1 ATP synthase F0 subunit 8 [Serilophus lunatus]
MPQLNPNPWLYIMLTSWLTLSIILQPKISSFLQTNHPSTKTSPATTPSPWNWPWT